MAVNKAGIAFRGLRCVGGCKNVQRCREVTFLGFHPYMLNVFPVTCFWGERLRVWTVVQMVYDV